MQHLVVEWYWEYRRFRRDCEIYSHAVLCCFQSEIGAVGWGVVCLWYAAFSRTFVLLDGGYCVCAAHARTALERAFLKKYHSFSSKAFLKVEHLLKVNLRFLYKILFP